MMERKKEMGSKKNWKKERIETKGIHTLSMFKRCTCVYLGIRKFKLANKIERKKERWNEKLKEREIKRTIERKKEKKGKREGWWVQIEKILRNLSPC